MRSIVALGFLTIALAHTGPCEPDSRTAKLLESQSLPGDITESRAARRARLIADARKALAESPDDLWTHRAYVDAQVGERGEGRSNAIHEYDLLLAKSPQNTALLYAAARAKYSRNTDQAIKHLEAALKLRPDFAQAHSLLAEIHASQSFRDKRRIRDHFAAYVTQCPDSVELSNAYVWLDDPELQTWIASHARQVLNRKTPPPAGELLKLWAIESRFGDSGRQRALREQVRADVERLQAPNTPRTPVWESALQYASAQLEDNSISNRAQEEMARLYPSSSYPGSVAARKWRDLNPLPAGNEADEQVQDYFAKGQAAYHAMWRAYPQHVGITFTLWRFTELNRNSTEVQLVEALEAFKAVLVRDPEALLISPPAQCEISEDLLRRNVRIEDVPQLVRDCIVITEKQAGSGTESDLYPRSKESTGNMRDEWYLTAYLSLVDAHMRSKEQANAADILAQIEAKLNRMRPSDQAPSEDKFRYAEFEARFWHMKGRYAEFTGRNMDALVLYRNSLVTFPVRRPRTDSREKVLADCKRLWVEFGGTEEGWNEWAAKSSLDRFYAGASSENAWLKLTHAKPDLELTDTANRKWKPVDLARRVTFVNLWATWCGPCREELPYLEQLRDRFKDRDRVLIIALNVDDDIALVEPFLKQSQLDLPITLARDFAYEYFPVMALPANWITGVNGTQMFRSSANTGEMWLNEASAAIEKALGLLH